VPCSQNHTGLFPQLPDLNLLATTAASAILTGLALKVALVAGVARAIVDQPNRSNAMHTQPTPRIGGLAMCVSTIAVALFSQSGNLGVGLFTPTAILVLVSLIDDRKGLSPSLRLGVHVACAAAFVALSFGPTSLSSTTAAASALVPGPLILVALVPLLAWSTNLYNFMDGADGLAGGMAVFGFGAYALAAGFSPGAGAGDHVNAIAQFSAILAGAALGFLFFNFPPAKVFMGDAGSIPLGFLAGALGLLGVAHRAWAWWFPLLVFSPFLVDATVTLAKRIWRRQKIWQAHREHYYHRLILSGWSHRQNAFAYYALMLACATSALYARNLQNPAPILGFWVVTYVLLGVLLERRFKLQNKNK
jgi:UDP-GlcNAc:undecaprenyl-phosphate/decaprenyl-phosphate GlcNAc-1-phosphate transferase